MSPTAQKVKSYFPKQKVWGLIAYQPSWGLTLKGWLFSILLLVAITIFLILNIYPFLALSVPIKAEALVIEGWIGDDGIKGAMAEFEQQNYQLLITVGSPLESGAYLSEYKDYAQLSATTVIQLGFDAEKIATIATPARQRDRTFASAMAVRQWLEQNEPKITSINLYSKNVHSRRSWLLFQKALNPEVAVGIIAHPPLDYDPQYWWTSSQGFRTVTSEAIAYIYAKFFLVLYFLH